jgi:hypothetical protein
MPFEVPRVRDMDMEDVAVEYAYRTDSGPSNGQRQNPSFLFDKTGLPKVLNLKDRLKLGRAIQHQLQHQRRDPVYRLDRVAMVFSLAQCQKNRARENDDELANKRIVNTVRQCVLDGRDLRGRRQRPRLCAEGERTLVATSRSPRKT